MKYESETHTKVFADDGSYVNVGPDTDGLGWVALFRSENNKLFLSFDPEEAILVANAMIACAANLVESNKKP